MISKIINFFSSIRNRIKMLFSSRPLLSKILFTIWILLIFRVAATITVPGVEIPKNFASDSSSFLGLMDLMGGGTIRRFSIVALGISPYITASILMTVLQSEIFPPLYRLSQSGARGRRKINIITRWLTLVIGIFQAIALSRGFIGGRANPNPLKLIAALNYPWFTYFALPLILLAGTCFALFLGEQITNKGVGNGTSLIIFSGVAVSLPSKFYHAWQIYVSDSTGSGAFVGFMYMLGYLALFLVLIGLITFIYISERHIPIQQTGSGMSRDIKQMSRLPIKINTAGVIPIMFAAIVIVIPLQVAQLLDPFSEVRFWIQHNLRFTDPIGLSIYIAVIFLFTIVMSLQVFNPTKVAENFEKNSTFIPGIRPGAETEKYLTGVILRLAVFSAFYLSVIAASTYVEQLLGMNRTIVLGGTGIIILVSVAIETLNQILARNKTRKISKIKTRGSKKHASSTGGLIW